jgi:uncharacterized protein YaaQ
VASKRQIDVGGVKIGGGLTFIAGVDETTVDDVVSVPMEAGTTAALADPGPAG